jgi:hypothetical protein
MGQVLVGQPAVASVWGDQGRPDHSQPGRVIPKYAVLVVHGMGQQTKFETLDLLAGGLTPAARHMRNGQPRARLVYLGQQRLHRLELTLETESQPLELHLYEAYWAPRTEGQVTLRDVVAVVFRALWNGVLTGLSDFRRWLFGRYQAFPSELRTVIALLVGLAAIVALMIVNTTIALVAGARWALGAWETVITDGLYGDLSTAFNFVFVFFLAFGLVLSGGRGLRRAPSVLRTVVAVLGLVTFLLTVAATVGVGLAIPILIYLHRQALPRDDLPLMPAFFGLARVDFFNSAVELLVIGLLLAAALAGVLWLVFRLIRRAYRALRHGPRWNGVTVAVLLAFVFGVTLLAIEGTFLLLTDWGLAASGSAALGRAGVWALLVVASLRVRRVIVEYVGDIVAYVQPHMLDRFNNLREKIRIDVTDIARAIYDAREGKEFLYDQVAVIGHSLGSVIAYDVLNRLVNEDVHRAEGTRPLDVPGRTFLFLTVGSPLDKTAFVFGSQRRQSEVHHALAATGQPLILDYRYRPDRWVNIYSLWDPISGRLDYYDLPPDKNRHPQAVKDRSDPSALTLFLAHVEYWEGRLLFETLLEHIPSAETHARRIFASTSCPHPVVPAARGAGGHLEA